MGELMLKGAFGRVILKEDYVLIKNKRIPLSAIREVHFEKGNKLFNGYVVFCTGDGVGEKVKNINTLGFNPNGISFMFTQNDTAELLVEAVKKSIIYTPQKAEQVEIPGILSNTVNVEKPKNESSEKVKICVNCGSRLLEKAIKCPTCGIKAKTFPVYDKTDIEGIEAQIAKAADRPELIRKVDWREKAMSDNSKRKLEALEAKKLKEEIRLVKEQRKQAGKVAKCPKCGSTSLSANKKGFGIGKAVVGGMVAGPLGLMAGNINAKKVWVTCLNCGKRFKI